MSGVDLGQPTTPVVVTGAGSGIGRACAEALGAVGRPVVCIDLNEDGALATAQAVAKEHQVPTHAACLDVTRTDALPGALEAARQAVGRMGALVHAAGISGPSSLEDLDQGLWDAVQGVHVRAAVFLVQAMAEELGKSPGAAVALIGSIGSFVAWPPMAPYATAKAALLGLTRSLALSLGPKGVRVNVVCPGYIDTPMLVPNPHMQEVAALGRLGAPEDVASVVRFLLSDQAAFVTGTHLVVDGGVLAGAQ